MKRIIIYDGYCNLCSGLVAFLSRRDKKNKFLFTTETSHISYRTDSYLEGSKLDFIIFLKDGNMFIKSRAIFEIINDLGGIWKFFNIFRILPYKFLDYIYDKIARYRYRIFGKCKCPEKFDNNKNFIR